MRRNKREGQKRRKKRRDRGEKEKITKK